MKKITLTANLNTTNTGGYSSGKRCAILVALLLVFVFGSQNMSAQVWTIDATHGGSGTNPEWKGKEAGLTPFAVGKNKSRVQYLISGSEFMSFGAPTGTITHVGFNVLNLNSGTNVKKVKNFTLKVWELPDNSKRSTYIGAGVTMSTTGYILKAEVFFGDLEITEAGWVDLPLGAQSFYHTPNGNKHLMIEVCSDNTSDRAIENFSVSTHKTAAIKALRGRYNLSDEVTNLPIESSCALANPPINAEPDNNTVAYSQRTNRADIRFTYKCTTVSDGGSTLVLREGSGCIGSPVKVGVNGGTVASGLAYQWFSGPTVNGPWAIVPGATEATATVLTNENVTYYRRRVKCQFDAGNTEFFSSPAAKVDGAVVNSFNGTTWSKGYAPSMATANESIVVNGTGVEYVMTSDVAACSCKVLNGGSIKVASGVTLSLSGPIPAGQGVITFEDTASLLQTTTEDNLGTIVYKRNSQPMIQYDYTYWAAPVGGQTVGTFSTGTEAGHIYRFINNAWVSQPAGTIMEEGVGYIFRAPEPNGTTIIASAPTVFAGAFTGTPNNGYVGVDVGPQGTFALVGNPYPSAIDADMFIDQNSLFIGGTIHFWTHNSPIASGYENPSDNSTSSYNNDDYASYNWTGMIGVGAAALSGGVEPGRYIGAGQSFLVEGKDAGGEVAFTNDMRVGGANNTQFFKPTAARAGASQMTTSVEKHRVWLQMANATNFKQTLVGYIQGATNGIDYGFDGEVMDGTTLSFYSVVNNEKYGIQGRALPFNASDVVPMGYKTNAAGTHTVSMYKFDGLFENQNVYLEDTVTGAIHNLKNGAYTFTTAAGTHNGRFFLRFSDGNLSNENIAATTNGMVVFKQNSSLHINSQNAMLKDVKVFDLSGRLLTSKSDIGQNQLVLENMNWSSQVIIVQTLTDDNVLLTKKVVF